MAEPSDNTTRSIQVHASNGPDTADMNEDDYTFSEAHTGGKSLPLIASMKQRAWY